MARVIGNYACEWKVAVEDPATLKRFRTFVNSDETDNNVVFVEERGQIRPASAEERDREDARKGHRRGGRMSNARWHDVCALEDIIEGAGVAALVGGRQIALFQVHGRVYALDNFDPSSRGQRALARPDRQPAGRARGRLAYLQESLRADQRPLPRRSDRSTCRAYPTRVADGRVFVEAPRCSQRARALVVAGNGMAGMRTVEELLKLGVADRFSITVFGAEPRGNYNRILLSPVLSGEQQADDIMLHRPDWYTRARHHAASPATRSSPSTASAAWCARAAASWRPTTGC